jgi:hypothetical protein
MASQLPIRLIECFALWNSAERAAKEAELITGKAVLASINELRYAGRWMVLVLDAITHGRDRIDDSTTLEDAITHVRLCCIQAKHDAIDSIVLYLHAKIELVSETYSIRIIAMFVDGYVDFLAEVKTIADSIINSREDRLSRIEIYNAILETHLPNIKTYMMRIRVAEATMEQQIEEERARIEEEDRRHEEIVVNLTDSAARSEAESQTNRRYFRISLAFAIIFGVASIILGIPGVSEILKWFK